MDDSNLEASPSDERTLSLLLADSDPADRALFGRSLTDIYPDAFLHVAESGHDALLALRAHRFDCALIDLHLPDLDGLDVAHAARRLSPLTCPALILTTGRHSTLLTDHAARLDIGCLAKAGANLLSIARSIEGALLQRMHRNSCA